MNDSEIVVVFREGSYHQSHDGSIALVRSTDGGQTFTEPVTIFATPGDNRDPLLTRLSDGRLAIQFATLSPHNVHFRSYVSFSSDNGRSWTQPRDPASPPRHPDGARGAVLEVSPGVLLSHPEVDTAAYLYRSLDGGVTWKYFSEVVERLHQFVEPTLLRLPGGRLLGAFRTSAPDGNGYVHIAESGNGGAGWSLPRRLPFIGYPQHLLLLDSSTVLMTYGYRFPPDSGNPQYGVRYRLSYDLGRSWTDSHEWIVDDRSATIDCGYPQSVLMPDHSVFVVYYVTLEPGKAEVWGRRVGDPRVSP
ncbi:MAG: sialidase family protein [Gemmatimonadales bacterium]